MKKSLKRKIRRIWRNRLLMSVGSLIVLSFAALQVRNVFKYRSEQPLWILEFSQPVELLTQEHRSDDELIQAISKIQSISQERNLQITTTIFQDLELTRDRALALALDRALDLELELALDRTLALELELAWELELELHRELELYRGLYRELYRTRELDRELYRDLATYRKVELVQARELEVELYQELAQELAQELELTRSRDRALALALRLEVELAQELYKNRASELVDELIHELNQTNNKLVVSIIATELELTHGLTLQTGDTLKTLLSNESNRARAFIQSGLLLGASVLVLLCLLVTLSKLQGSSNLPRTAQLITFLPEEYVAELGYLKRRLQKKKASAWQIRRRLIHEFVFLLWVHYVQLQIDKLFLADNKDHTIDD